MHEEDCFGGNSKYEGIFENILSNEEHNKIVILTHDKGDKSFSNVFFVSVVLNSRPLEEEQHWPPPKPAYGTIANGRDSLVMSKCFVYITAHTFILFHIWRLTPVSPV